MARKTYLAYITWVPYEEGGRKVIPVSDWYAPIIKLPDEEMNRKVYWSLFVKVALYLGKLETIAIVKYLSEAAPDNLKEDVEFELFEGDKLVAKGIIIKQIGIN